MQVSFNAPENASIFDLVLNTYGSLNLIPKFLKDNKINSVNYVSKTGDVFVYESDLISDEYVNNAIVKQNYSFSTAKLNEVEFKNIENYLLAENESVLSTENENKILI